MNIIFETDDIQKMKEKYIVLPLDTFRFPNNKIATAHCVVDKFPLDMIAKMDNYIKLHCDMVNGYKTRQWNFCIQALDNLIGSFGGELDTYYINIKNRVSGFLKEEPPENWTYIIQK